MAGLKYLIALYFIYCVFSFSLALSIAPTGGNNDPPLPDFLTTYNDVRSCFSVLFSAMKRYEQRRAYIERIFNTLDNTCKTLDRSSKSWGFAESFFNKVKNVPLGSLPNVAKILGSGTGNIRRLVDAPKGNVCKTARELKSKLDKYDRSVQGRLKKYVLMVNNAAGKIDKTLAIYKSAYEKYKILKYRKATVCPSIVATFNNLKDWKKSCQNVLSPVQSLILDIEKAMNSLKVTVEIPVKYFNRELSSKLNGPPLNFVTILLTQLRRVQIRLPKFGSRPRGVGVIPTCCPPGWNNSAGLCYPPCPGGFQVVAFTCMQYCHGGYRTVGTLCSKFWCERHSRRIFGRTISWCIPKTHTYWRPTRPRFGRAPATFRDWACRCRPSGRGSLESGLCYHKCGSGHFVGYPTSVLNNCWESGTRAYKLDQLMNMLNIFEQIKKVPGVDQIMQVANRVIDLAMKPIMGVINTLFNGLRLPQIRLLVDVHMRIPKVLRTNVDKILSGMNKIPIVQFKRNGLCVDVSL